MPPPILSSLIARNGVTFFDLVSANLVQAQRRRQRSSFPDPSSHASLAGSLVNKRKGSSCQCSDGYDTPAAKRMRSCFPDLPEDIWLIIHSFMPMREAAQAALLSHAFLRSWRCHPILIFIGDTFGRDERRSGWKFSQKVDHILSKQSCIGVKVFKLDYDGMANYDAIRYLTSWLPVAVKPGRLKNSPSGCVEPREYNFPCSLLSDGIGSSLWHLQLRFCAFHPTAELDPLRNLTSLRLSYVSIILQGMS